MKKSGVLTITQLLLEKLSLLKLSETLSLKSVSLNDELQKNPAMFVDWLFSSSIAVSFSITKWDSMRRRWKKFGGNVVLIVSRTITVYKNGNITKSKSISLKIHITNLPNDPLGDPKLLAIAIKLLITEDYLPLGGTVTKLIGYEIVVEFKKSGELVDVNTRPGLNFIVKDLFINPLKNTTTTSI